MSTILRCYICSGTSPMCRYIWSVQPPEPSFIPVCLDCRRICDICDQTRAENEISYHAESGVWQCTPCDLKNAIENNHRVEANEAELARWAGR